MVTASRGKPVIGLVGGIGSGKSLVARQMAQLGCGVIDADELARQVLDEPATVEQLVSWWGPAVLGPDGRIDRKAVGRIVFDAPAELARLEGLVHPQVHARRRALRRRFEADRRIAAIVEDCPLLLEKGLDADCDVVIFVASDRDRRLERLARARGWTEADLQRREKNQLPLDIKARRADYVVDNSATEADTMSHVRRVLSQILHDRV